MKSFWVFVVLFFVYFSSFAQDVLYKADGSEHQVKVLEISGDNIKYKKWSNLTGPTYNSNRYEYLLVRLSNGTSIVLSTPNVQNYKSELNLEKDTVTTVKPTVTNNTNVSKNNSPSTVTNTTVVKPNPVTDSKNSPPVNTAKKDTVVANTAVTTTTAGQKDNDTVKITPVAIAKDSVNTSNPIVKEEPVKEEKKESVAVLEESTPVYKIKFIKLNLYDYKSMEYDYESVESLMLNTSDAQIKKLLSSVRGKKTSGAILGYAIGIPSLLVGGFYFFSSFTMQTNNDPDALGVRNVAIGLMSTGVVLNVTNIILRANARKKVKDAIALYNMKYATE